MTRSTRQIVVVSSTNFPAREALANLLSDTASCEHLVVDQSDIEQAAPGNESQQIEQHHQKLNEQALQDRLEEFLQNKKYTGAAHVFVMQGEDLTAPPSAAHAGLLKAMMDKAMTHKGEVIAVLVPQETEESADTAAANFEDAVASHESLLKPFSIPVFGSLHRAAHHLGAF